MLPILSRQQSRAFDRYATEHCAVPSIVLMENAGRGACDAIVRHLASDHGLAPRGLRVLLICGAGNNGADGLVVARRLLVMGAQPKVVLLGQVAHLTGNAATNARSFLGLGGEVLELAPSQCSELGAWLSESQLVVDAIFGTGLSREVAGVHRYAIEAILASRTPCIALDVPSGLDADTGRVLGACTRPELTVTFAQPKLGLMTSTGAELSGRVELADIGVPASLFREVGTSAWAVEAADVKEWLATRFQPAHKGEAGRVLVVAGSPGTVGAAQLVARGAHRGGAGLVTLASFREVIRALETDSWETMTLAVENGHWDALGAALERADSVVLGPGIGLGAASRELVNHVLSNTSGRLIVDADALSHFVGRLDELAAADADLVLTPHPGEAGRLLGIASKEVEEDRFGVLDVLVERTAATVLLKGKRTLVGASGHQPVVNLSGHAALATAGSGDVLSGLVAALACSLPSRKAAICGAWLHGMAGESWARRQGAQRGLLAREIADLLPAVMADDSDVLSVRRGRMTD